MLEAVTVMLKTVPAYMYACSSLSGYCFPPPPFPSCLPDCQVTIHVDKCEEKLDKMCSDTSEVSAMGCGCGEEEGERCEVSESRVVGRGRGVR